jgi:TPP-dependent pyruvate/acetoin dehydrogenase alpha subunit
MQDANGISQGLPRIVKDILDRRCSSTDDMANSIWFLQESVFALHQSLYEERCVTEEEFKQLQQELKEQVKKQQEELQKQQKLNQTEVTPTLPERNSKKV